MIYFIRTERRGLIKIGTTVNLLARLHSHRFVWPEMRMLGVHDGGESEEQAIHRRFDHLRVPSRGKGGVGRRRELFSPEPELIGYIKENCHRPDVFSMLHEESGSMVHARVEFPPEMRRLLRLLADDAGMSLTSYARLKLTEILRKEAVRRDLKVLG